MANGKLYTCCVIPYIRHFNKIFNQHLEVTAEDSIDIYKAKNMKEIVQFLGKTVPFCQYCALEHSTKVSWELSEKDISEWIY
jgi:hypothetical protein